MAGMQESHPPDISPLEQLRAIVGASGWITDPELMAPYLREWRGLFAGSAAAVVSPACTGEVARVMAVCHAARIGVVPQSGNTGLCGGAAPDQSGAQIILSLRRMNRIRSLDAANDTLVAEAGCILADVQAAARQADRLFPLSLAAEGSCMLGGNLATNAGGTNVLRYGNTRDLVLGLEVVLPDGRVWDGLSALRKDNAGYELRHLFIGSEGTLGVITAAVLRLFPQPREQATALLGMGSAEDALTVYTALRRESGDSVSGCELISAQAMDFVQAHIPDSRNPLQQPYPWYLLVELSSARVDSGLRLLLEQTLARLLDSGVVADAVVAESLAQAGALWRLRESIPEAQRLEGASIKNDISVPVSSVPAFVHEAGEVVAQVCPGVRVCAFGHLGDGNLHFNLQQPVTMNSGEFLARWDELCRHVDDVVLRYAGSVAAEHGIGQLRIGELQRSKQAVALELMRTIKAGLDPHGIMNPGKVLGKR